MKHVQDSRLVRQKDKKYSRWTDEAMQRFGFSTAHLRLTILVDSLERHFGLQYLQVSRSQDDLAWHSGRQSSANTFVQLRSQCAGKELSAAARK